MTIIIIMVYAGQKIKLSTVKSTFSEVVKTVKNTGEAVIVTVDGKPAAQIVPIASELRDLSTQEVATFKALMDAVLRIPI
ncbi:MAG: type II toxin-antitoxin system Phd/YefM family antitoxin [Deltaproteobacteria bacterium]|nr:type II toxin-antitoxin system Phd/YefM family antitoxin [Deltaproteobacteria bacterium]